MPPSKCEGDKRLSKKFTIALLLMLVCTASLVLAQNQGSFTPPSPATMAQHRMSYLTTVLSLSPEQQQQGTTIFTNAAASEQSLHSQMKTARQSLAAAIEKNDAAAISQISTTIGGLVAKQTLNDATARAALYQTLTPEQQSKLTQLEGQHHGMGFVRGGF
jgi:Spy/CpxP family protein refolding chaperone